MTEKEILKEVFGDDDDDDAADDDSDEDKKQFEIDFEIVDESFQCPTGSMVMSGLDTLSVSGMFNDTSVKGDVMAMPSKIETLLMNR